MNFEETLKAITQALLLESAMFSNMPSAFLNKNRCTADNCIREIYSSGFCNAHYIRSRKKIDMSLPIKNRKSGNTCLQCDNEIKNGKGGWNLCQSHYNKRKSRLIKSVLVKSKGSKCVRCNGQFSDPCFDFHHLSNKTDHISEMIRNCSIEEIALESQKCVLLCSNCHREIHAEENI